MPRSWSPSTPTTFPFIGRRKAADRRLDIVLAHCWSHARRKFFDLAKGGAAPIANEALVRIGQLYAIESDIDGQYTAQRLAVRRENAAPLVKDLKAWLEATLHKLPGGSPMAGVIRYLADLVTRCVGGHPQRQIDGPMPWA